MTLRYRYIFEADHRSDFYDPRFIQVTVSPTTGEVVSYEVLGEHIVADYTPKVSREEALDIFWEHYEQHRGLLVLNRVGLVRRAVYNRPEAWYWQVRVDYPVVDMEAFKKVFPHGEKASLIARIDAETGELFAPFEPKWQ
ncbi:MAG: hypothetical protein GF331_14010 [Chitinivibrionales bacterium]|nr:hypothetical protein [Chitinivibrionales bacterium]